MPPEVSFKPRKPPACDRCKAKRVLCHPQPPGMPCPRCLENGSQCVTSPVVRKKPTRKPREASVSDDPSTGFSAPTLPVSSAPPPPLPAPPRPVPPPPAFFPSPQDLIQPQVTWTSSFRAEELPSALVVHLLECFTRLPQYRHPIMPLSALRVALSRTNWQPHLLSLPYRALTYAILATSALISPHPAILGDGPVPASLEEVSTWPSTTDWQSFGRRREGACRALSNEAFRIAKEADVTIECSHESAATAYLLDFLESRYGVTNRPNRPYGSAYVSHLRVIASGWDRPRDESRYIGFLTEETLGSTYTGTPILFSAADHRLMYGFDGSNMMKLEQIAGALRDPSMSQDPSVVFATTLPYASNVNKLARRLEEDFTGASARRRPLNELAALEFHSDLAQLECVLSLLIDRISMLHPSPTTSLFPAVQLQENPIKTSPSFQYVLRSISYLVRTGFTTLALAFHRDLERRSTETPMGGDPLSRRQRERLDHLRRQAREVVEHAGREVGKCVQGIPSLPHATHFRGFRVDLWAAILLPGPQSSPTLSTENAAALESILQILRLQQYSYVDPTVSAVIHRIEAALLPLHRVEPSPIPLQPFNAISDFPFFDSSIPLAAYPPVNDLEQWFATAVAALDDPLAGLGHSPIGHSGRTSASGEHSRSM